LNFDIDSFVSENISAASKEDSSKLIVGQLYNSQEHGIVSLQSIKENACTVRKGDQTFEVKSSDLKKTMRIVLNLTGDEVSSNFIVIHVNIEEPILGQV
jgi:hypothetical protein